MTTRGEQGEKEFNDLTAVSVFEERYCGQRDNCWNIYAF